MPGIFGICDSEHPLSTVEPARRMARKLRYKADDRDYSWADAHCVLGGVTPPYFNAITEAAHAPDAGLCLVMAGEVFNADELQNELGSPRDASVARLMLAAYQRWGTGLVHHVNGTFAIAIYDAPSRSVTLITDRAGTHFLHYAVFGSRIVFSSEMKAMLCNPEVKRELDPAAVVDFFTYGYVLGTRTFVRGVTLVPPATTLRFRDGHLSSETYWRWPLGENNGKVSVEKIADELHHRVAVAVQRQVRGVPRVGLALSGGLDSRVIAAPASEATSNLLTFTFGEPHFDEVRFADRVATTLGTSHSHVRYSLQQFSNSFDDVVWMNEGLINTPEYYWLSRTAGRTADVLLTGNGGDDLSGRLLQKAYTRNWTVAGAREYLFAPSGRLSGAETIFGPRLRKWAAEFRRESFESSFAGIDASCPANLIMQHNLRNQLWRNFSRIIDLANFHVRHRQPFLDYELLDCFARVPPAIRMNEQAYRRVLIRYSPQLAAIPLPTYGVSLRAEPYLRPYYRLRNVVGRFAISNFHKAFKSMAPPTAVVSYNYEAYRGPLRDYLRTVVIEGNRRRGYFDQQALERMIGSHADRTYNHSFLIHKLIAFELFQRMFLDPAEPAQPAAA